MPFFLEEENMEKKTIKDLKNEYKQIKIYMGVYQIKNKVNGKIYIHAEPNMKNRWIVQKGHLINNMHVNPGLQADWNEFGEDAFEYSVLCEMDTSEIENVRLETKNLEKLWLDELQPYGDKGYHTKKD